ncbi:hypothetical protein F2Q70_00014003 [Brassica cretica]|uniref:F-box associated beta-propeller type 1 domain-containing protein n=1 Tax=Brassica cretica TaxID=69181 RepID=A0A8S9I205_BRACR|nr:hypothetical protein F2Q70_00014003 [Brassica cretica]
MRSNPLTLASHRTESDPTKTFWKTHDFASDAWKDQSDVLNSSGSSTEGDQRVTLHTTSDVSLNGTWYRVASNDKAKVFMGDRFSLLKQSHLTKKIQIWVTKNKIHKQGGRDVEWMNFMEVSTPNLPDLIFHYSQPSYFINDDKRLVVCSCDETGRAWIYVVGDNKLISKTKIDLLVDFWPSHCSFIPSLVSVPGGKREEAK